MRTVAAPFTRVAGEGGWSLSRIREIGIAQSKYVGLCMGDVFWSRCRLLRWDRDEGSRALVSRKTRTSTAQEYAGQISRHTKPRGTTAYSMCSKLQRTNATSPKPPRYSSIYNHSSAIALYKLNCATEIFAFSGFLKAT